MFDFTTVELQMFLIMYTAFHPSWNVLFQCLLIRSRTSSTVLLTQKCERLTWKETAGGEDLFHIQRDLEAAHDSCYQDLQWQRQSVHQLSA